MKVSSCSQQVLRDEWNFQGYVFSDYGAMDMLRYFHRTSADRKEVARKAITAGVDLEAPSLECYASLAELVEDGTIPVSMIDTCVKRILRVKFKAGLFEKPYASPEISRQVVGKASHKQLAQLNSRRICYSAEK